MPYLRSLYPYAAEYHPRRRPSTSYFPDTALFYDTISDQCSPLLSRPDSNTSSWNFFVKLKNIWSWKDNNITTNARNVPYAPFYLPPSEILRPHPVPLPLSTVDRLPYVMSYPRLPLGQNIVNKSHAFDTSLDLPSVQGQKPSAGEPASHVSIARHSKRSRSLLSPRNAARETRHREEGVRKRVRFSTNVSGQEVYRFPSRKTRPVESRRNRFLPFADWIAYHCNNILTEDSCSKLIMTVIDEKLVAEKITSILEAYFPERISVDGLEAPTASFLAVWYLGRLFRHGIFCLSDVDAVGAPEAVIRVFLLGLTLADKWLNDGSRRLKDWGKFCRLPLRYRTSVERRALRMLDYNISITNLEWRDWLDRLEPSTSKFLSANFTNSTQITANGALEHLRRAISSQGISSKGPVRHREVEISSESMYFLRFDLLADSL